MIKIYTIGFTNKTAEEFFTLLKDAGVKKILDIRINNVSQLAGFAKLPDLQYFARVTGNIGYEHKVEYAPTKEMLKRYRDKEINWEEYEKAYINLLAVRKLPKASELESFSECCLLCSEHEPDKCHRRLLAECMKKLNPEIEIVHLK